MGKNITYATIQDIEDTNDRINKIKDVLISVINQLPVEIGHATAAELVEILEEV